jgi:hypothetical protein
MADDRSGTSGTAHGMSVLTTVIAVALLVAYLVFIALQWKSTIQDATAWSRHEELLNGIQALAFAAAGALFGTTVQRQVTNKAEDRANIAEAKATQNAKDAEKGRALQRAIEVRAAAREPRERDAVRGGQAQRIDNALSELAELARRYYEAG